MKFFIDTGNWVNNGIQITLNRCEEPVLLTSPDKFVRNIRFDIDVLEGHDQDSLKEYIGSKIGLPKEAIFVWNIHAFILSCLYSYRLGRNSGFDTKF